MNEIENIHHSHKYSQVYKCTHAHTHIPPTYKQYSGDSNNGEEKDEGMKKKSSPQSTCVMWARVG
jgi:hypothetical protein